MSFDLGLANERVLVTGGTKGIGGAVAETLRDAEAQVIAVARSIPAKPIDGVRYLTADLSTVKGASAVAQSMLQQLGSLDILIHMLGGTSAPGGGFAALDEVEWSKELNQNLMPAVRLDRALLPSMIAQRSGSSSSMSVRSSAFCRCPSRQAAGSSFRSRSIRSPQVTPTPGQRFESNAVERITWPRGFRPSPSMPAFGEPIQPGLGGPGGTGADVDNIRRLK